MVLCKKKKRVREQELGKKWIWTAIDTPTRLIVCFLIGDRTLEDARRFLKDLVSRTRQQPLFTSDELPHYADGLKELFHKLVAQEPTGQPGRPRSPEKIIDENLDYATVHKTREKGRIVKVETKVIFGSSARIEKRLEQFPGNKINTSYVERSNLNWRMWDAHLTRKSLMFAKSFRWLKAKFARGNQMPFNVLATNFLIGKRKNGPVNAESDLKIILCDRFGDYQKIHPACSPLQFDRNP